MKGPLFKSSFQQEQADNYYYFSMPSKKVPLLYAFQQAIGPEKKHILSLNCSYLKIPIVNERFCAI